MGVGLQLSQVDGIGVRRAGRHVDDLTLTAGRTHGDRVVTVRHRRVAQCDTAGGGHRGCAAQCNTAERIRKICRSAADSAELMASLAANGKRSAQRKQQLESDRYERAAKVAMEIAMKMSDALMRDAAVREIVDLCLTANNTKTAKILFRAIQAPAIRDMVLRDHPELGR